MRKVTTGITTALGKLIVSEKFKKAAAADPKLRIYAARVKNKELKTGAAVDLLLKFGYKIEILDPPGS